MFISFGHITKKHILFLILPTVMVIRRYVSKKIELDEANNMFYIGFIQLFGRSLNGILWIVLERRTMSIQKEVPNNEEKETSTPNQNLLPQNNSDTPNKDEAKCKTNIQRESNYPNKTKKKISQKIFLLLLVCFLDFFSVICNTILRQIELLQQQSVRLVSLTIVLRTFAIAFFSHFIIKNIKMYIHHYLSIVIILIVVVVIHFISYFTDKDEEYVIKILLNIFPELLFSIMYVCAAKYLSKTTGNIYKLLFIDGIIGIVLSILLQIIAFFTIPCDFIQKSGVLIKNAPYCDGKNIKTLIENFKFGKFDFGHSVLLIIVSFIETWLIWLLVISFSVNHFAAIHPIPLFIDFIISQKDNDDFNTVDYIMFILGSVIIIFMIFVYNEMIILKFCGLDTNVEIDKRGILDAKCDFQEDIEEIHIKADENYLIDEEDIGRISTLNE